MEVVSVTLGLLNIFHKVVSFHHPGIVFNETSVDEFRDSNTGNEIKRYEGVNDQVKREESLQSEQGKVFFFNFFEDVLVLLVKLFGVVRVHQSSQDREDHS